jgi:hypothetical protein
VRPLDGAKNVYHSGSTAGYRAHLNRFPDSHTSVAVLCNGSDGNAPEAANAVSRSYLDKSAPRIKGGVTGGIVFAGAASTTLKVDLHELVGEYWSDEAETTLIAAIEDGRLVLRRRPGTVIELKPEGSYSFRGSIGIVTFYRNGAGRIDRLSIKQDRVWHLQFTRQQ